MAAVAVLPASTAQAPAQVVQNISLTTEQLADELFKDFNGLNGLVSRDDLIAYLNQNQVAFADRKDAAGDLTNLLFAKYPLASIGIDKTAFQAEIQQAITDKTPLTLVVMDAVSTANSKNSLRLLAKIAELKLVNAQIEIWSEIQGGISVHPRKTQTDDDYYLHFQDDAGDSYNTLMSYVNNYNSSIMSYSQNAQVDPATNKVTYPIKAGALMDFAIAAVVADNPELADYAQSQGKGQQVISLAKQYISDNGLYSEYGFNTNYFINAGATIPTENGVPTGEDARMDYNNMAKLQQKVNNQITTFTNGQGTVNAELTQVNQQASQGSSVLSSLISNFSDTAKGVAQNV
jgi:hypothetical protein